MFFSFSFPSPRDLPIFVSSVDAGDCARVFSHHSVHLLAPVSASSHAVFGLASDEPGALLFGAELKYEQKSHQAYEWVTVEVEIVVRRDGMFESIGISELERIEQIQY